MSKKGGLPPRRINSNRLALMLMETERQYYRVERRHINFIRFIFEAYEGLAVVSTIEAAAGLIALAVAPGCGAAAERIMADLSGHFLIEHLDPAPAAASTCGESAHDS
jgi:Domain of unknown function (DUF4911)